MVFVREKHLFKSPEFVSVVAKAIEFFHNTPAFELPCDEWFSGAGVYALYYLGPFEHYVKLSEHNRRSLAYPIYVGKAVPRGWRMGRYIEQAPAVLYGRLQEHTRSIEQGKGLHPADFRCRFMILEGAESDLIVPVEAALIRKYSPLWNCVIDGFGNHDPGKGRYNQARSEWDMLHPGRPWAEKLRGTPPPMQSITEKLERYFANWPPS